MDEFARSLAHEVCLLLTEVGKLREEKVGLEMCSILLIFHRNTYSYSQHRKVQTLRETAEREYGYNFNLDSVPTTTGNDNRAETPDSTSKESWVVNQQRT